MSSSQKEEYLRRREEEAQRKQQNAAPRKKQETPEEAAHRWRWWRNVSILTAAGLVLGYYAWVYLVPMFMQSAFPFRLPDEVAIEEVVAEIRDDPEAAKKYANKRIIVVGKIIVEHEKKGKTDKIAHVYYQLANEEGEEGQIPVVFADVDDALNVTSGDTVRCSGVLKSEGAKLKLLVAEYFPYASSKSQDE